MSITLEVFSTNWFEELGVREEIKIFNSLDLILSNSSIIRITGSVCAILNASVSGPSSHTKLPSLALML